MKTSTAVTFFAVSIWSASVACAAPSYNITALRLTGPEYTRDDGYIASVGGELNEAGQVSGHSSRYNGGSTYLGQSVWLYDGTTTVEIGLAGPEHTRDDGYKYSGSLELNESGQVSGISYRYNSGSTQLGRSVWLYDGMTTTDIGLVGPEHTRDDGSKYSDLKQWNKPGQVIGDSIRYNGGSAQLGRSAWLYDGTTTIEIGLVGSEYARDDGYKYSDALELNDAGQVIGDSSRYDGSTDMGVSAWLYDGTTTNEIGLSGPEYTREDGNEYSHVHDLNEAGQVIGDSSHYDGSTYMGVSAWLYDGTTTNGIGLSGPGYARDDGFKYSDAFELSESGQVSGYSYRYNGGSTWLGRSPWLYDGTTTVEIGLVGAEHTRDDGYKSSVSDQLNEAGQVVGLAERFEGGSADLGRSAWLYDGTTTTEIGLVGPEHTRDDGYKSSLPDQLNEAGQVIGYSTRYNGSTALDRSLWLYDGTTTIELGLIGPEHTSDDGYRRSLFERWNEAGQVTGTSYRYNGGRSVLGLDAWLYDPGLDQTFQFEFSTRSDGLASSHVYYLGEDGLALGAYSLFDELDNNLGQRAFYFTVADGVHDLGPLVAGGLPANGWDFLASAVRANGRGQIVGVGKLASQSGGQSVFLLTPVPEPASVLLLIVSCALARVRRRFG